MKKLLLILIILPLISFAQLASNWQEYYHLDAGYRQAERVLQSAEDDKKKNDADPAVKPVDITRSIEAITEAKAKLLLSGLTATETALTAVGDVLTGRLKVKSEAERVELTKMDLNVAEIKKDKGAASDIELAKAKQKYYDALNSSDIAKRELKSAETRVKMFVANVPDALPEPVVIDPAKLSYLTHANYITAQNKINEADRIVAISSGPDTTAIDKVNRERDLQNIKDAMGDVEKTLRDGLDAAKRNYINAQDSYQLTKDRLVLARKDLNTSKERFNAGAISKLALQSYISAEVDSQLSVEQAKVSLWLAGVALLKASGGAGK
jgi:hypothetical protein